MKMNQPLAACSAVLLASGPLFAAVTVPSSVWQLNGNLDTSVGTAAALGNTGGWTPSYQNFDGTPGDQVLVFPEFTSGQGIFVDTLDMPVNGGGAFVNNYSIVMDVKFSSTYQANEFPGGNDGDSFIRPTTLGGGLGSVGDYAGIILDDTWYRIGIVNDVVARDIRYYVNGTLVNTVDDVLVLDESWSLFPSTDARGFYLFADDDGETGAGFLGSLAVWDKVLSDSEFTELGSASAIGIIPEPSAALLGGVGLLALMRRRR
jgi:hypothetical protein